jgi:hypothetical protein
MTYYADLSRGRLSHRVKVIAGLQAPAHEGVTHGRVLVLGGRPGDHGVEPAHRAGQRRGLQGRVPVRQTKGAVVRVNVLDGRTMERDRGKGRNGSHVALPGQVEQEGDEGQGEESQDGGEALHGVVSVVRELGQCNAAADRTQNRLRPDLLVNPNLLGRGVVGKKKGGSHFWIIRMKKGQEPLMDNKGPETTHGHFYSSALHLGGARRDSRAGRDPVLAPHPRI